MLSEETHGLRRTEITDEGRDTWAEIERVVHPPSSLAIRGQAQIALPVRATANLQTYINEMKEPSDPLFSLSVPAFTLFLHCQKLRYPRLDRARIKRNSRVSRIRRNVFTWFTYNSDQTTRRFEWTCVIAVRASMRAIRFDLAFRDFRVLYHICWSVEVNVGICSKRKSLKLIFRFFLCLIREFYELIRWSCH